MADILFIIFIILILGITGILILLLYKSHKRYKSNEQLAKWYRLALTDDLTKIQNRAAYSRHISELKLGVDAKSNGVGIVIFDIDNFKSINDTNGHLAGDDVLKRVAAMLSEVFCSSGCNVYRIGGDEFAVIIENSTEKEIINMLLKVRSFENKCEDLSLSKGYAMITGKETFDEAFAKADEMLYADKASKKKRIGFSTQN